MQGWIENIGDQRRFARPETPVTQTKTPRGIETSRFFKLWCLAPEMSEFFFRFTPLFGRFDFQLPER